MREKTRNILVGYASIQMFCSELRKRQRKKAENKFHE